MAGTKWYLNKTKIFIIFQLLNERHMERNKFFSNVSPLALIFSILIIFTSCSKETERIMTVNGWLEASKMGITLTHEHIMLDWIGPDSTGYHRWNRDSVTDRMLPFFRDIAGFGCKSFIDCTPSYLGRDPFLDKRLSELSGLNIIISTGYYGAMNDKYIPGHARTETAKQLAERWLKEWNEGIDGSGIRPGIIKIAVARDTVLSDLHVKIVEAAAMTHLESGLTIVSHTGPGARAFEQLEILRKFNVSPEAFVWTHAQEGSPEDHIRAAKSGAWISLDNVTSDSASLQKYVMMLKNLKDNNLLHKVLLSHDSGWYTVGVPGGGDIKPYTAIFTHLIPGMKKEGFTDDEISLIMEKNPQKAYNIICKQ
jgi:phosphotriesterase-related protein